MISYEQATAVTQSTVFIIWGIIAWIVPLILFSLCAVAIRKKSSGGTYSGRPIITSGSLLIVFIIFGLLGVLTTALWYFPIFLRFGWLSYLIP